MPITLEQLHKDMLSLKKDIKHIKDRIDEDFEIADDVVKEVEESRVKKKFISHEDMKKEFD